MIIEAFLIFIASIAGYNVKQNNPVKKLNKTNNTEMNVSVSNPNPCYGNEGGYDKN